MTARRKKPKKPAMVREETVGYGGAVVLYRAPDGKISMNVRLEKETLWLDAHQMARLFDRDRSVILRHIRNIYDTNELDRASTCAKNAQVAADGKMREMDSYNLDVIIGVGYRVNSQRGTQFRIWATQVLRVVADYERALDVLDDYDHQRVRPLKLSRAEAVGIEYDEALSVIDRMREKFGGSSLFGREKDASRSGSLSAVM